MVGSAELPKNVEKFVRDGLAQRIVIGRAKRPAEVGGTLLPGLPVGSRHLIRPFGPAWRLRLAANFATQPLVPPRAGARASYKSCIKSQLRTGPIQTPRHKPGGLAAGMQKGCRQRARHRGGKPNRLCLVPTSTSLHREGALSRAVILPGLQQSGGAVKDRASRYSREILHQCR